MFNIITEATFDITDATFDVNAIMSALQGDESNLVLAGTWKGTPWRIGLNEPSDTLQSAHWVLEMGDHRYPLRQLSQ